ncbi:hypothetical protein PVAP13_3KG550701 [Panicum virgatum]|uniref:Uncharacterized protein n=1 Tax=Panicum virgatum TaxID=38727 RepID=A0A8T0VBB1_PANVG|nr:hypothetical protein PVAP13_3KG550701 [Panicum virgatum]
MEKFDQTKLAQYKNRLTLDVAFSLSACPSSPPPLPRNLFSTRVLDLPRIPTAIPSRDHAATPLAPRNSQVSQGSLRLPPLLAIPSPRLDPTPDSTRRGAPPPPPPPRLAAAGER